MKSNRVIVIAAALTVAVTFYSLSELHSLSEQTELSSDHSSIKDIGWKDVAHRAVEHVEHLPRLQTLPIHGSTALGTDSNPAKGQPVPDAAAKEQKPTGATQAVDKPKPDSLPSDAPHSKLQAGQKAGTGKASSPCTPMPNTELWGDVVLWGDKHKVNSAEECCEACKKFQPKGSDEDDCNVWVFCGDKTACGEQYGQCWLKHLVRPEATKPARSGPDVYWTSGIIYDSPADLEPKLPQATSDEDRKFHIVTSAQGTAVHWQVRVHYYWYKKQKAVCEKAGKCDMGGFTRLLHSGHADDLMDEIPSFVVDPLPQELVEHSWYVVLNRPYAFVQWVQKAKIPERYVLMSEPDHIFLRPLPNFMHGDTPAAFPFFYIEPSKKENVPITSRFANTTSKKELESIAPIGNSPTYMLFEDMKAVMPIWMNLSIAIFKDKEANEKWGWVQEMYGFTIALYKAGIKKSTLFLNMMAQPPWDANLDMSPGKPFYIVHYTYGMDYTLDGKFTPGKYGEWRFDKRTYSNKPVPRHLGDPPKGMKNDLVRALINSINEATANIPCWDLYAETGAVQPCNETIPAGTGA